jgi:defect-in-organelle-trafficking protein DotD
MFMTIALPVLILRFYSQAMVRFSHLLLLFLAAGLSACSNIQKHSNDHPQIVAAPDSVSAMLATAADKASNALQTLASVEAARTPAPAISPIGDAPPELRRAVTVNWVGPAEPIAKALSDRAGYEFQKIGPPPPVPAVVSLNVENKPLIEILRDIGLQLGVRGDIRVDSARKLIELQYPPGTGIGG